MKILIFSLIYTLKGVIFQKSFQSAHFLYENITMFYIQQLIKAEGQSLLTNHKIKFGAIMSKQLRWSCQVLTAPTYE